MKRLTLTGSLLLTITALAQTTPNQLWNQLAEKRAGLAGAHQEFEGTVEYRTRTATQASKWTVIVDMSQALWRETGLSGAGDRIQIFDGKDAFRMEESGDEYVRVKRRSKDPAPLPSPYTFDEVDWKQAKEISRTPCGFAENDHDCVVLRLPLKTTVQPASNGRMTTVEGIVAVQLDTLTGLIIQSKTQQTVNNPNAPYIKETTYLLKRSRTGVPPDSNLFTLPSNVHEVKELAPWDASRINKQLTGKLAPELEVVDIQGKPVSLAAYRGKTLLLDFWTTWCPPCRADGPALEKLNQKYGNKELAIVGVSVDEDRRVVEKFLKENVKSYPIVLTSENEMPRPYQIGVFPTYIVIDKQGNVTSAVQGDKGFESLRNLLRKAGMETD